MSGQYGCLDRFFVLVCVLLKSFVRRLQYLLYSCFLHILLHFDDFNALIASITERGHTETLANICTFSCYVSIFRYLAVLNCLLLS